METGSAALPRVVLFSINGVGLGHLSRSLAYARRMRGRAVPVFFSLASAIEVIQQMGFTGDYFVSEAWTRSHYDAWSRELLVRFGLLLEEVRPTAAVFDGTWPFQGFLDACDAYGVPRRVWSNRALHRPDFHGVPVGEELFDLVIEPGEIGSSYQVERASVPGRKVRTPPVTLLADHELLDRDAARESLGLDPERRYALVALGAGNLNDVGAVARGLVDALGRAGFNVAYARAPISIKDVALPAAVQPIELYPLVRYMRAFDVFVGAAGYNTCCEVVQSGVPSLLVPNAVAADDQAVRAAIAAAHAPAIVFSGTTADECPAAIRDLLRLLEERPSPRCPTPEPEGVRNGLRCPSSPVLDGAERAVEEILALCAVGHGR